MSDSSSIVLFGGGIDSAAMVESLASVGARPLLLFFDYRQKARYGEHSSFLYFAKKHRLDTMEVKVPENLFPASPLIDAKVASNHAQNYLAGRNMLFAALSYPVAVRTGAERIYLGASPADESSVYLDAKKAFADAFNRMLVAGYGEDSPKVMLPLVQQVREDYVLRTLEMEPNLFDVTFSCYESTSLQECGVCTHCQIKRGLRSRVESMQRQRIRKPTFRR